MVISCVHAGVIVTILPISLKKNFNPSMTLNMLLGNILLIFMWGTSSRISQGVFSHSVYISQLFHQTEI